MKNDFSRTTQKPRFALIGTVVALLFFPTVVFAQGTIIDVIGALQNIVEALIPFFISLALLAILFGLTKYAFKAGDPKAQDEGRRIILGGIITLFVMVSVWGFVIVLQTFFFGPGYTPTAPQIPQLPTTPGGVGGVPAD